MEGGAAERRLGLALLVQFAPQLALRLPGQAPLLGEPARHWLGEEPEEARPLPAWQLLRDCLVGTACWSELRGLHWQRARVSRG